MSPKRGDMDPSKKDAVQQQFKEKVGKEAVRIRILEFYPRVVSPRKVFLTGRTAAGEGKSTIESLLSFFKGHAEH